MNRILIRAALAATTLVTAASLVGCSDDDMSGMQHSPSASQSATASGTASESADFNEADVTFAQMMTPHHEQAVAMCDIILQKTGVDPKVTELANQIKAAQQPEIDTMAQWLTAWGKPPAPGDMAHGDSDGMMTAEDMADLESADGPTAQRLFLEQMIKHHEGAIMMARQEILQGKNAGAVDLARTIESTQKEEVSSMKSLLDKV
jgi:uncharacterized protein (DUF305 family)